MGRYRGGTIQIDVSEVLDQIDDDELLEEVRDRKLILSKDDGREAITTDELEDAYRELLIGRPEEARAILERLVRPKWSSSKLCERDYVGATKGKAQC